MSLIPAPSLLDALWREGVSCGESYCGAEVLIIITSYLSLRPFVFPVEMLIVK